MFRRLCPALIFVAPALGEEVTFVLIPRPPGYHASGVSVSGDGTYVAGTFFQTGVIERLAYRWSQSGGVEFLPRPTGQPAWRYVTDLSENGSVIIGGSGNSLAYRWVSELGTELLPHPLRDSVACSADGALIARNSGWPLYNLYFWSSEAGFAQVAAPPQVVEPRFVDMTPDGSVAIGFCSITNNSFRHARDSGTELIYGRYNGLSSDGLVLVGGDGRWTARTVTPRTPFISGNAVAADGWRAVGNYGFVSGPQAALWDPVHGTRALREYLLSLGVTALEGWTGTAAHDISSDGTVVVGTGTNPQGRSQAWKATIPPFCYANCDGSTAAPALNVADFTCFLQRFAQDSVYANCNNDAHLNVADFTCFLQKFAAGCH